MHYLSVQNLTCVQGAKTLFDSISFGIEAGEKIALIGINGCGKTSLLNEIVAVSQTPNAAIMTKQGLKISYLSQLPTFDPQYTILDHIFQSNTPTARVLRSYHRCLEDPSLGAELSECLAQMDIYGAWDYEAKITAILDELKLYQLHLPMSTLSGGMIKKVSLAQVFFEEADLLILDEPTNHLDIETITWLENTLKKMNKALLMVTHDRYFLNKVCTKIIEIDKKQLFTYHGNYQAYLEQKALRLKTQQRTEENIEAILRVELEWLSRGPKARSTKQKARIQRIDAMQTREVEEKNIDIELGVAGRRLGKKILELKEVTKTFENRVVIPAFSYTFKQREKIGILGPNGSGKTTLLNLITGQISPDSGIIDAGVNTFFGYFDQHSRTLETDLTVYEHIHKIGSYITLHDGTQLSAAKLLEQFLFPSYMFKTKIKDLSGGERRRLDLVSMLLKNPNFLLFDEPTNDLDITTLSILENFLLTFAGCAVVISHDRYFMDRVVDQLLVFDEGQLTHFSGTYSDYVFMQQEKGIKQKVAPAIKKSEPPQRDLHKSQKQEMKTLETEIQALELEFKKIDQFFLSNAGSALDYEIAGKRRKEVEQSLEIKFAKWEQLASLEAL